MRRTTPFVLALCCVWLLCATQTARADSSIDFNFTLDCSIHIPGCSQCTFNQVERIYICFQCQNGYSLDTKNNTCVLTLNVQQVDQNSNSNAGESQSSSGSGVPLPDNGSSSSSGIDQGTTTPTSSDSQQSSDCSDSDDSHVPDVVKHTCYFDRHWWGWWKYDVDQKWSWKYTRDGECTYSGAYDEKCTNVYDGEQYDCEYNMAATYDGEECQQEEEQQQESSSSGTGVNLGGTGSTGIEEGTNAGQTNGTDNGTTSAPSETTANQTAASETSTTTTTTTTNTTEAQQRILECGYGHFYNDTTETCGTCTDHLSSCLACGFAPPDTTLRCWECADGYFLDTDWTCKTCVNLCQSCSLCMPMKREQVGQVKQCVQCDFGYSLVDNICQMLISLDASALHVSCAAGALALAVYALM